MIQFLDIIVDVLAKGVVVAVVGIGLYAMQKKSQEKENKRDMARILRHEVNQTLSIMPGKERERITSARNDKFPNSRIYSGLLQTGNIRFFSDELDRWYSLIDNFKFSGIDSDAGIEIVQNLEDMEYKNRSYRSKARSTIFRSKHSNRHIK